MAALTEEQAFLHIQTILRDEIGYLQRQYAQRGLQYNPIDMAEFEKQVREKLVDILLECGGVAV
jgi:hypothetical protein